MQVEEKNVLLQQIRLSMIFIEISPGISLRSSYFLLRQYEDVLFYAINCFLSQTF